MKKITLLSFTLLIALSISARPQAGHYDGLNNKSGNNLWAAIHTITNSGYHSLGYDGLLTAYQKTDVDDNGQLIDMYGGCTFAFSRTCGNYSDECDCYNREHSLPKSWWGGSPEKTSQGCDIFHVVPTDGYVNNRRSNYAFGEVSNATYTYNGNKLGSSSMSGYSGTVFEPQDEYKGDFARGYFGTMAKWELNATSGNGAAIFNNNYTANGNFGLTTYGITLLMKWHRQDPVSEKELKRNDSIEATQGNRNPFIDYPELAEYLWGAKKNSTVVLSELTCAYDGMVEVDVPTLFTPKDKDEVQFGNVTIDDTETKTITVRGTLLESGITLAISGEDAAYFTVSPTTVTAAQANAGQPVAIIYTPAEEGLHTATLTISSQDFANIIVNIEGTGIVEQQGGGDDDDDLPEGDYVKVTASRADWSGIYLIVYEDERKCLNGTLTSDANGGTAAVTIANNTIAATTDIDSYSIEFISSGNGYALRTTTGMYVGNSSKKFAYSATPTDYDVSYSSGEALISNGSYTMKYNTGEHYFRFYTSGQGAVQLYRKAVKETPTNAEVAEHAGEIRLQDGIVEISLEKAAHVEIYDYTGRVVLSEQGVTSLRKTLPQGIYIIRFNQQTSKIVVR